MNYNSIKIVVELEHLSSCRGVLGRQGRRGGHAPHGTGTPRGGSAKRAEPFTAGNKVYTRVCIL